MHILVGSFYKRHAGTAHGCSDRPEAHGFRVSFTPLDGVLFTSPSRYWCTIGRLGYLALGRGRPRFPPDFSCPVVLTSWTHRPRQMIRLRDSHPLRSPLPAAFGSIHGPGERPAVRSGPCVLPRPGIGSSLSRQHGLGSSRFARRYYGNPLCSSGYVRCFSSPGSPRTFRCGPACHGRGLPHSDTAGSSVASTSPTRFVAWPRPSSAPDA